MEDLNAKAGTEQGSEIADNMALDLARNVEKIGYDHAH